MQDIKNKNLVTDLDISFRQDGILNSKKIPDWPPSRRVFYGGLIRKKQVVNV